METSPAASAESFSEHLVVVGTGIQNLGQFTVESIAWLKRADRLLYCVNSPVAASVIRSFNPERAESLHPLYHPGKDRMDTYQEMVAAILSSVRSGAVTVVAFYGHPGVFAYATHESIRRARLEGFRARMLPAISAEDCLFSDLGVDPAEGGCLSADATDFLCHQDAISPRNHLILWQVGVLGNVTYETEFALPLLPLLVQKLTRWYPANHKVTLYEAPLLPGEAPKMLERLLYEITASDLTPATTLYVPPTYAV